MSDSYQEDLPQGWRLVELKNVVRVVNGTTPQSSTSDYWGGDIVWITPTDLGKLKEREIVTSERKITQAGFDSCGLNMVPIWYGYFVVTCTNWAPWNSKN